MEFDWEPHQLPGVNFDRIKTLDARPRLLALDAGRAVVIMLVSFHFSGRVLQQ